MYIKTPSAKRGRGRAPKVQEFVMVQEEAAIVIPEKIATRSSKRLKKDL